MLEVAIIGGGLSGLALAKQLHQQQRHFSVFEARDRFGGRILSHEYQHSNPSRYRTDLGPCWVWPDDQPRMAKFIDEYQLELTPQWQEGRSRFQADHQSPPQDFVDHMTYESARRFTSGTFQLIETLLEQLPADVMNLGHRLIKVTDKHSHIELEFETTSGPLTLEAKQVVLTLPPRLIIDTVHFQPELPAKLQVEMKGVSTWMAGHAKAVIYYKTAFWREAGYSGSAFAAYQGAALGEIFDASSADGKSAALSGFFALPPALRRDYVQDLPALITEQLVRLFGEQAADPESIQIQDWFTEQLTATEEDETAPLIHPNYGLPALQLDHWSDKLFFCGTETAKEYGGYLEGALVSAERVASAITLSFQSA